MKKALITSRLILVILLAFSWTIVVSQSVTRTVYGKIYYKAKGRQYPASFKRIVIMPNTTYNLSLAQSLYNTFDDNTVKNIKGSRTALTSKDGAYEFSDIKQGRYIIRVTGMGGMVIQFTISSNSYSRKKIPDMPADYY